MQPKSRLVEPDVQSCRLEVVHQSLFEVLQRGIAGNLSPEALEHSVVESAFVHHAGVEVVNLELRQVVLDSRIHARAFSDVESFDRVAAISAKEKFEKLLAVDKESLRLSMVLVVEVHVREGGVQAHLVVSTIQVLVAFIGFAQVLHRLDRAGMRRFEMVLLVSQLVHRHASVELVEKQEVVVGSEPLHRDDVSCGVGRLIRLHLVFLPQEFVFFELGFQSF